jgi:hypothetical protein
MECSVASCKDYDFGSENSCWVGRYSLCKIRMAFENGVLVIRDEQPVKRCDEVSVLRGIVGNGRNVTLLSLSILYLGY